MEQLQVMIDEVSTDQSPSPNSHSIVVAEWAAIRIQTAFRGFLVLAPPSTCILSSQSVPINPVPLKAMFLPSPWLKPGSFSPRPIEMSNVTVTDE